MHGDCELINIQDLFEDENFVITKPRYFNGKNILTCVDLALKDSNGDIISIKALDLQVL